MAAAQFSASRACTRAQLSVEVARAASLSCSMMTRESKWCRGDAGASSRLAVPPTLAQLLYVSRSLGSQVELAAGPRSIDALASGVRVPYERGSSCGSLAIYNCTCEFRETCVSDLSVGMFTESAVSETRKSIAMDSG